MSKTYLKKFKDLKVSLEEITEEVKMENKKAKKEFQNLRKLKQIKKKSN